MGNFRGHAGPGTAFLTIGIVLVLRALQARQTWIHKMRTDKRWLAYEGVMKIVTGIIGILLEGGDMVLTNSYGALSHSQHLQILSAVLVLGIIDLLCLYEWLREPIWAVINPIGFAWIGIIFNVHHQSTDLRVFAHTVNEGILVLVGLSRFIEVMIAMHSNKKYYNNVYRLRKERSSEMYDKGKGFFRRVFKDDGKWNGVQVRVHPLFSNPAVYRTVFPMLTGLLVCLDGLWWWQMAFSFYVWPAPPEMENGHHAIATAYKLIYTHIAILVGTLLVLSLLLKLIDRRRGKDIYTTNVMDSEYVSPEIELKMYDHNDQGDEEGGKKWSIA